MADDFYTATEGMRLEHLKEAHRTSEMLKDGELRDLDVGKTYSERVNKKKDRAEIKRRRKQKHKQRTK